MGWMLRVVAVVLLLAGCGGGDAKSVSKAQFVDAADRICSRFPATLQPSDVGAAGTLASATRVFAGQIERGVARLRRLPLPRGSDRARARAVVESFEDVGAAAGRLDAATAGLAAQDPTDSDGVSATIEQIAAAATALERGVKASHRAGRAFGLRACGRVLTPLPATALAPRIESAASPPRLDIPPPRKLSPARRQQFREGRRVAAQAGCLACHAIAGQGNGSLGGDLSDIGTRLSSTAIAAALRNPVAPMPSYRTLRGSDLRALVAFLGALRSGTLTRQPGREHGGRPGAGGE